MFTHRDPQALPGSIEGGKIRFVSTLFHLLCLHRHLKGREHSPIHPGPPILIPHEAYDCSLPSQRITAGSGKPGMVQHPFLPIGIAPVRWTRSDVHHVPLPVRSGYDTPVSRLLKGIGGVLTGSQDGPGLPFTSLYVRGMVHLIGAEDITASEDRLPMAFTGSGISGKKIVPPVLFHDVRPLKKDFRRGIYLPGSTYPLKGNGIKLLDEQPALIFFRNPVISYHGYHVLPAVIVVKERGIEAEAVDPHGIGPGAVDRI